MVHYVAFLGSHVQKTFRDYLGRSHATNNAFFVRIGVRMLVGKSEATTYMCVKSVHQIAAKIVLLATIAFVIAKKAIRSTRAISVSNNEDRCFKTANAQNSVSIVAAKIVLGANRFIGITGAERVT